MEIIVLDIETTGLYRNSDAIVEIGMVLVDTDKKTIKPIFDNVVNHDKFDKYKHKNAWIFSHSNLTVEDVINAKSLEEYRPTIQSYLDTYPMTAFNMKFDTSFLEENGFSLKKTKCLMESSKPFNKNRLANGARKTPNVEEIYHQFYPEEKDFVEAHRGCDDAYREGKILLKLCEFKSKGIKSLD